jgi:hypothetical protein
LIDLSADALEIHFAWIFLIFRWLQVEIAVFKLWNLIDFQPWAIWNLVLFDLKTFHLNFSWRHTCWAFLSLENWIFLEWALVILNWFIITIKLLCNDWSNLIWFLISKRLILKNWLFQKWLAILIIDLIFLRQKA